MLCAAIGQEVTDPRGDAMLAGWRLTAQFLSLNPDGLMRLDDENVDGAADRLRTRLKPDRIYCCAESEDGEVDGVLKSEVAKGNREMRQGGRKLTGRVQRTERLKQAR
jgi:hypothetical protein